MDLITTIGGNASNSMITVEEADVYIADSPYPQTAWEALSDDEKALRLVLAAKFMASKFSWLGIPMHENQGMPFPRYVPPRRLVKAAWPFATEFGADCLLNLPTEEQLDALDIIPDDIKRAQAYIAYGVIHRGFQGVTDPAGGTKVKPQIKTLELFDSLKVSVADRPIEFTNSTAFDLATQSEYFLISMLIEDWITHISWGYGTRIVSPLPEVESGTSPTL